MVEPDLGSAPPPRAVARQRLPGHRDRVRDRHRPRPVVEPPARLPRASRGREGRFDDATETAMQILRRRRASTLPVMAALSVLGRLRARRGDPDPWGPLDEAMTLTGPELQRLEPAAVPRIETAWLMGDRERVVAEADRLEPLARAAGAGW